MYFEYLQKKNNYNFILIYNRDKTYKTSLNAHNLLSYVS